MIVPDRIYSDGMVLQQKGKAALWGKSTANQNVLITTSWNQKKFTISDDVKEPIAVRYAWVNNPIGNLYNKAGLPSSPFRTDHWKGVTE